jgi:hypothetical protein
MRRIHWPAILGVPALMAMAGATECESFDPVTIPANDDTAPILGTRIFVGGEESYELEHVHIETDDQNEDFWAIAFAVDAGGVRSLQMAETVFVACRDEDTGAPVPGAVIDFGPQSDEQDGDAGDEVSNGIWLAGAPLEFADYLHICDFPGVEVDFIEYSWSFAAEDFSGNDGSSGGEILYREPGTCACMHSGLGNLCIPNQMFNECNDGYLPQCNPTHAECGGCSCE